MRNINFNGQCPACKLQHNEVIMRYNVTNDLECPTCNLRIYYDGKKLALIHRQRGKNEFALRATPIFTNIIYYTGADLVYDCYSDGSLLLTPQALSQYIKEVSSKSYQNILDILIDSYIEAFYNDKNTEYYNLISDLAGIDISQTVFKQGQKSNIYLFHYLHHIIECYEKGTFEQIENYIQNSQIHHLYQQHITPYKMLVKNDLYLQKLMFKKYMIELIKVIYSFTEVVK